MRRCSAEGTSNNVRTLAPVARAVTAFEQGRRDPGRSRFPDPAFTGPCCVELDLSSTCRSRATPYYSLHAWNRDMPCSVHPSMKKIMVFGSVWRACPYAQWRNEQSPDLHGVHRNDPGPELISASHQSIFTNCVVTTLSPAIRRMK